MSPKVARAILIILILLGTIAIAAVGLFYWLLSGFAEGEYIARTEQHTEYNAIITQVQYMDFACNRWWMLVHHNKKMHGFGSFDKESNFTMRGQYFSKDKSVYAIKGGFRSPDTREFWIGAYDFRKGTSIRVDLSLKDFSGTNEEVEKKVNAWNASIKKSNRAIGQLLRERGGVGEDAHYSEGRTLSAKEAEQLNKVL